MLNLISPINQLGYGITGLNICKALFKFSRYGERHLGKVSLWPIGQPNVTSQEDADIISSMISNSRMPDFNAPCVRIWHQHDMSQFVGRGPKVGFPIFELDSFNEIELYHLNSLDLVFVCSKWAKGVMIENTSIKSENIHVIPLGVDSDTFKPCEMTDNKKTIFFNCGKWEFRKGHDIILEAFNSAFSENDDVELWMMCENPFLSEDEQSEWISLYKNSKLGKKIRIISRKETQEEVYNIMSQVDCGVFPSRGEGWNLELLEMMACGKAGIATEYSAHTEFCNSENSILIQSDQREVAYDGRWFHGEGGKWLKHTRNSLSQLCDAMRSVHTTPKSVNWAGVSTANKYSWENSARKILEALNV